MQVEDFLQNRFIESNEYKLCLSFSFKQTK